ncbi:MAG: peptidase S24 [Proteobacteria bacterium]|nr:peptidase S24 [Pseudomonadota bacterium]
MSKKTLHPLQDKLLKLLADHSEEPLTVRELQEALEASSTSVVVHHMQQLEKKGYLKKNPYNPRDYQIIKGAPESAVSHLNLYGCAACGPKGSVLDGDPIDRIPIASRLLSFPADEAFMVKAKGASMEPKIAEGDFVIVRRTQHAENGKTYVCVNDGEVLIKKVILSGKSPVLLHSFNPDFPPFIAGKGFRVEGEVKGVISKSFE